MASEFTPGPWWPEQNSAGAWGVSTYRDGAKPQFQSFGATICHGVGDGTEARTRDNREANARLIAAAPELLEALELAREIMADQLDGEFPEPMRQIDAAIAKARGK